MPTEEAYAQRHCFELVGHFVVPPTHSDGDGKGNVCDDDDGVIDVNDNCLGVSNPHQTDTDHDGLGRGREEPG